MIPGGQCARVDMDVGPGERCILGEGPGIEYLMGPGSAVILRRNVSFRITTKYYYYIDRRGDWDDTSIRHP